MSIIEAFGWTMATQFEPHRKGFLYRQDRKGPPILVTVDERNGFVRTFGWQFIAHVAGFLLAVIAAAMLTARFFPRGDETGGFFLMGGLLTAIGVALYLSIKRAMHAPARTLAGREPLLTPYGLYRDQRRRDADHQSYHPGVEEKER